MVCLLVPFSIGVLLLAIISLAFLPRRLRMGVCNACEYPLSGLPANGTCPECGAVFDRQTLQYRVPKWGSIVEDVALVSTPIVIGASCVLPCILATEVTADNFGASVLFSVFAGLVSIAPAVILTLLARFSVGRAATWLICIAASLPGAAFAAIVFITSVNSADANGSLGALFAPFYGATASALAGGLIGCVVSIREEIRASRLRTKPHRIATQERVKLSQARINQG